MTRGEDGHALSPAVVVACHPPLQPLGQEQSTAAAADSLVDESQPGGSEQQQQLQQEQEQEQQLQQEQQEKQQQQLQRQLQEQQQQEQQQLQQEQQQEQQLQQEQQEKQQQQLQQQLQEQQQQTGAPLLGWGDECVLLKQEQQQGSTNTEAQQQRLSAAARQTTSRYPGETPSSQSDLKHPLQAGVDEAMNKEYVEWPTSLLQRVCTHRCIGEMSACGVNESMAQVLTEQDLGVGRHTPYMDDLQEIALLVPVQGNGTDAKGVSEDDFSESDQVCDMLLPEGVRIEYAGAAAATSSSAPARRAAAVAAAGGGGGGAGAAVDGLTTKQRNVMGKRKKRGAYAKKTTQGKRKSAPAAPVKATKKAKSLKAGTEVHESKAVPKVPPPLPRLADERPAAPAGTIWLERTQEAEARSAQLALSVKVYEAHKEFSAEIEEIARQKAEWHAGIVEVGAIASRRAEWAGGRTDFREKFLEKFLQKLEARMLKDADAEI